MKYQQIKWLKSKSLSHCLTELFPIYQNKHWTVRRQDNHSVNPSSHRITLLKFDMPLAELNFKLAERFVKF